MITSVFRKISPSKNGEFFDLELLSGPTGLSGSFSAVLSATIPPINRNSNFNKATRMPTGLPTEENSPCGLRPMWEKKDSPKGESKLGRSLTPPSGI